MSDAPVATPKSMVRRAIGPDDKGARGFLVWLRAAAPSIYKGIEKDLKQLNLQAKQQALGGYSAFGEVGTTDVPASSAMASSSWTDAVSKLIQAYGQYKLTDAQLDTVKKITDANLLRAQQGLEPLAYDAGQLGLAPTVNFGLSGDTSKLVMYGLAGLAAMLILPKLLKGH